MAEVKCQVSTTQWYQTTISNQFTSLLVEILAVDRQKGASLFLLFLFFIVLHPKLVTTYHEIKIYLSMIEGCETKPQKQKKKKDKKVNFVRAICEMIDPGLILIYLRQGFHFPRTKMEKKRMKNIRMIEDMKAHRFQFDQKLLINDTRAYFLFRK